MTPTAMKKSDKKRTAPGKKPPFFSVVLPLHPQKSYVQKSLDSILAQDFQDFEVLAAGDSA